MHVQNVATDDNNVGNDEQMLRKRSVNTHRTRCSKESHPCLPAAAEISGSVSIVINSLNDYCTPSGSGVERGR